MLYMLWLCTTRPLYCANTRLKCPNKRGVLISGGGRGVICMSLNRNMYITGIIHTYIHAT